MYSKIISFKNSSTFLGKMLILSLAESYMRNLKQLFFIDLHQNIE